MSKTRLSTIELFKEEMKFSAGHFTIFPPSKEDDLPIRENLHGHNYNLYASFTTLISDENLGLSYDYRFYKEKLYHLCRQLNETVILPSNCHYLSILDEGKYYHLHFNDEVIIFLKRDVTILPITNVTVEELSYWYVNQLLLDKNELEKNQITEIIIKVFSGPGQSGSACWKKIKKGASSMANYLIITGGSRGIGAKTIAHFFQDDWKIINISRTEVTSHPVDNVIVDLSEPLHQEELRQQFTQLLSSPQQICLVHNAAFYKRDSLDSLVFDDFIKALQINLIAAVVLNQVLIPFMLPGSSIIYIGSTLSEKAVPGSASYTMSKHAALGLMKVTCQDLIQQQIRSCCVCPGLVNTSLLTETMDQTMIDYLLENKIIGKRLIEPEEIARIIHFCAVTPSINGTTIHANLGQFAE